MHTDMTRRHKVGARLLAAALSALFLAAPWMAELAECRAPGCVDAAPPLESHTQWADAGAGPCVCPSGCAAAPRNDCTQSDEPGRESIVGRRGHPEPSARSLGALAGPAVALPLHAPSRSASWTPFSDAASAPLFIVHRSLRC
jgi:hypothetical protein